MSVIDRVHAACPLFAGRQSPGFCRWCDAELGGRRRWCSNECQAEADLQHNPRSAARAALRRDGFRCVTCGHYAVPRDAFGELDLPARWDVWDYARGGPLPRDPDAWWTVAEHERHHAHVWAAQGLMLAHRAWDREPLEVNHVTPALGVRTFSCVNHVDNLETLCRPCHLVVTRHQHATGVFRSKAATIAPPELFEVAL